MYRYGFLRRALPVADREHGDVIVTVLERHFVQILLIGISHQFHLLFLCKSADILVNLLQLFPPLLGRRPADMFRSGVQRRELPYPHCRRRKSSRNRYSFRQRPSRLKFGSRNYHKGRKWILTAKKISRNCKVIVIIGPGDRSTERNALFGKRGCFDPSLLSCKA